MSVTCRKICVFSCFGLTATSLIDSQEEIGELDQQIKDLQQANQELEDFVNRFKDQRAVEIANAARETEASTVQHELVTMQTN